MIGTTYLLEDVPLETTVSCQMCGGEISCSLTDWQGKTKQDSFTKCQNQKRKKKKKKKKHMPCQARSPLVAVLRYGNETVDICT